MKKRSVKILSLVLALVMMLSLFPLQAFAAGTEGSQWGWGDWWSHSGPEMPAQQLKATDSATGVSVTVDAPEGALPEGTELNVKAVSLSAVQTIVDSTDGIGGTIVAAEDITFYYEGSEIEPEKNVSVTLASDAISNTLNPTVLHLDCSAEEIESGSVPVEVMGSGTSFSSKDFSVYAVSGNDNNKYLNVKFYTDANAEPISQQVINLTRYGDLSDEDKAAKVLVFDPGVPDLNSDQSFEGWADSNPFTEQSKGWSVDEINAEVKANYASYSNGATLSYYAKVYTVRYVVYHDQAGAVLTTQAYHIHSGNTTESVKIDWSYVGFMGEQNFAGWVTENYIDVMGDYPLYKDTLNTHYIGEDGGNVYKNGTTYDLSTDLQLYPYLNTGHWLVFDTYKDQDTDDTSTSYIGPVFYEEGTNTVAPAAPTRTGYEFKGWYKSYTEKTVTDANGKEVKVVDTWGDRFIFGSPISEDTTVYAKWEPKETTYQVVFWQQNPTDSVDAVDTVPDPNPDNLVAKTYSFYKSDVRTATTGQSVTINTSNSGTTADNRLGGNDASNIGEMGFYFSYNGTNSDTASVVVKGDGSTTLNVYYDRKVITYNFYGDLTTGYSSFNGNYYSSYYPHYGIVNNSYVRLNNSSSTYSDGDYRSPNGNWYYGSNTKYNGTVYHLTFDTETLSNNSDDIQFGSIQGLYGSTMDSFDWSSASTTISGNDWPYSGQYLMWHDATTGRYQNKMFQYTTGEATTSTTIDYYLNQYEVSSTTRPYTCLGQDTDGNFTITLDESGLKSSETVYFAGDEYFGYELDRYNKTTNNYNSATQWNGGQVTCSYSDIGSNGHAYFYYKRNQWNFVFESNNSQVRTESVYWEKSLSDLAGYVPTNGPEGCYFDGWYADPGFDTKFDFSQEMPNHAVQIYAKWTTIRFRVVLDPTGGESGVNPSDISFVGNQATTFRLDYGELVEGSSINNAQRTGYTLLGWYLDKNHTIPYNFSNPVTTSTQNVDMEYINASDAQRQGDDPWNINSETGNPLHYTDVGRDNVRGKLTIYALWRQDPDGVVGINVKYLADDKDGNDGTFSQNSEHTWNDPKIYADQAMAFGQPASTPDNTGLQFLYWEILDRDGNPVDKAYPGQLWRVNYSYAVEEAVSGAGSNAASPVALSTETPKLSRPGEIVHPTAETMTVYAPVDTIETGADYLIGVKASNGTTYLLMSYNPSTGTYYGSASLSGYTTDHLSYAIPAVLDENGNVTGVDSSNISGATLAHVEWIFNSTSNGKYSIQSGYNSNYYLRVGDDSINTTNLNLYPASYSSGYGATWVWDSSTHRLSHYYSSSYAQMYLAMLTVSGVPTYFDVDSDANYARTVQLFKKTTIEVGPTMHTVTFMDGYTHTKIADVPVEDGTAATAPDAPDHSAQGMIFTGWDTAFDNVTEDITVTALYVSQSDLSYTVTFRYMNSNGEWVTSTQTVQHGQDATAPTLPTPPTGYTFNSWDKKLTNITSNLTINAVYKQTATKKYVVTLRAVYGKIENGKTFINWYLNDGTDTVYQMVDIDLNTAYSIPTPATYNSTRTAGKGLVYEDHVFLGWARVENATGAAPWSDHSELNESDLYLEWLPNEGTYKLHGSDGAVKYSQVAADNDRPYHDMYAVWGKVFYVCHSGTGTIERRVISATTGTGETREAKTFNLIDNLDKTNYLYGGYYKAYDNHDSTLGKTLTWTTDATAAELNATGSAVVTKTNAVAEYDAAKVDPGVTWKWADAYKDAPGDAIVPVAGQTYYVKEVPTSYLQHYTHYTYKFGATNGTTNLITKLWMVTDVDDNNYWHVGIKYLTEDNEAKVVKSLKISTSTQPVTSVTLTADSIFGSKGVTKGYLAYTAIAWPNVDDNKIDNMLNFWVTPDNMMVTGTAQRGLVDIQSADTIHIETLTTVDSTITRYSTNS